MMTMREKTEIRYCEKCGCELMSTNKKKLCDNCRRTRDQNGKWVFGIAGVLGTVVLTFITKGKVDVIKKK